MILNGSFYEEFHQKRYKGLISVPKKSDFSYRTILPHLQKLLQKDRKVLDIGCGNGALSFFAASRGCKVLGIDISKKAISGCRFNAQKLGFRNNLAFQVQDLNSTKKIAVNKFDVVICSEVIEHLTDDVRLLNNIYRILKPGGVLFLSTPSINSLIHKLRLFFSKKDYFDDNVGHLRRYELQQLIILLKTANFKIVETYKTEGVVRNFFFVTSIGTKLQRFLKSGIKDIVLFLDKNTLFLGESDLIVIATKPI